MEPRESALWRGTSELSGGAQSGHFAWVRPRRPGARWDTLLEVESLSVSGLTLGDLLDLLDHCEDPIRIRTAGAGDRLKKDLSYFLSQCFQKGSADQRQQESIRNNLHRYSTPSMAARGASQKFPEVAANTCSAIEMQQNKPFATHF